MARRSVTGALLDANLLCLLAVGASSASAINHHSRLNEFGPEDYSALTQLLEKFGDLVLCPHVIAETSNLITYRQSDAQIVTLRKTLARIIDLSSERSIAAQLAVADTAYQRLGFTDAVLLLLADNAGLILVSVDLGLCLEAGRRGLRFINYNHLRDGALRLDQIG